MRYLKNLGDALGRLTEAMQAEGLRYGEKNPKVETENTERVVQIFAKEEIIEHLSVSLPPPSLR